MNATEFLIASLSIIAAISAVFFKTRAPVLRSLWIRCADRNYRIEILKSGSPLIVLAQKTVE